MSLILHHIKNTRSLRPLWLLEEMGLEYTLVNEGANIGELDKTAFRSLNPMGKMPVFFDGDKRVAESVAICHYIADSYGGDAFTRKPGDADFHRYLQLLHFGEGGMGGYTNMLIGHTALLPEAHRNEAIASWARAEIKNCLAYLEGELGDRDYFLGTFSLCDIAISYCLFLLKITRNAEDFGPGLKAYFDRIKARDAWQKACSL